MAKGKKPKTIMLVSKKGTRQEFTLDHAERLLDMGDELNGGWRVAPDSEYEYDEENGLKLKGNK